MNETIYFARSCPACGRTIQIKLSYLGKQVRCVHCSREFSATDEHAESASMDDPVQYWLNFTTAHSLNADAENSQMIRPK